MMRTDTVKDKIKGLGQDFMLRSLRFAAQCVNFNTQTKHNKMQYNVMVS